MSTETGSSTTSQPSSILFFIAVAIGVVIAMVFIFFSLRYYVRTKLGIYATARVTAAHNPHGGLVLLNSEFPMQTYNVYNHHEIQQHLNAASRRRRFTRKRRLTEEEVDHLFPPRTYHDWLDGGAQRDIDRRDIHEQLKEEDDEDLNQLRDETNSPEQITNENSTNERNDDNNNNNNDDDDDEINDAVVVVDNNSESLQESKKQPIVESKEEVDLGNPYMKEIHYDSGSCAICIDAFDQDDMVRGLICGHVFHQECLDPWLTKRKACCPMCKRDYYMKGDDEEDLNMNDNDNESLNNFTELQYTTLSERVAEILSRNPELEDHAKESIKKYLSIRWKVFWFIMGISKLDLINSAIVNEDQRLRSEGHSNINNNSTNNNDNNENTEANRERVENMA